MWTGKRQQQWNYQLRHRVALDLSPADPPSPDRCEEDTHRGPPSPDPEVESESKRQRPRSCLRLLSSPVLRQATALPADGVFECYEGLDPPLGGDGRHGMSPSNPVLTDARHQTAHRMRKTMGGRTSEVPFTDSARNRLACEATAAEPSRTQRSGSAPSPFRHSGLVASRISSRVELA